MAKKKSDSTDIVVKPVSENTLQKKVDGLVQWANEFRIKTKADCESGVDIRGKLKDAMKQVEDSIDDGSSTYKVYKSLKEKFNRFMDPLKSADKIIQTKIKTWVMEQEAAERKKLEEARLEAERKAILEEQDRVAKKAENLITAGREDEAEELLGQKIHVEPVRVKVESKVPDMDRRAIQFRYKAVVVDMMAMVKAVADGDIPLACIEANQAFLNNQARQFMTTEAMNYPGVEVRKE